MNKQEDGYWTARELFWFLEARWDEVSLRISNQVAESDIGYLIGFLDGCFKGAPILSSAILGFLIFISLVLLVRWDLRRINKRNTAHVPDEPAS